MFPTFGVNDAQSVGVTRFDTFSHTGQRLDATSAESVSKRRKTVSFGARRHVFGLGAAVDFSASTKNIRAVFGIVARCLNERYPGSGVQIVRFYVQFCRLEMMKK
ncbi:hypothetical protein SGGMMB4_03346 [Sodalis glossinidius str. 'morsitans']|uniref:Uncharacterized protein n=1 Tax=Sodalis glossinidius (strain morsitans) TaxID=343509 RepID=A0A193QK50_SODGM|nr:hypothetical protein SGGMMB4_03346 [Sodalis glossinidius str. 'morsitans']